MYTLTFYVPQSHLEVVKTAVFDAGAGQIGSYSHCAWQVLGTGQFKPLVGSQPHIGTQDTLETLAEWRVEMVVAEAHLNAVIQALKASHPYETPAYHLIKTWDLPTQDPSTNPNKLDHKSS